MHYNQNNLAKEASPYLLQHKNNPVWWQTWNDSVLQYAQDNNKLLLISIGYSACHWCHVMEKECFEDAEVANIMNNNFVCIKVDREERPDIDMLYMNALHLMQKQGGWPLNMFALPTGEPLFGGTYFPKDKWTHAIQQLQELWHNNTSKAMAFAKDVTKALHKLDLNELQQPNELMPKQQWDSSLQLTQQQFDTNWGGINRAPKFMMPSLWNFVLNQAVIDQNKQWLQQVELTLNRISWGALYDTVGGGFSRYSVDPYWKVPHFEKMLYDNAQLLSLYSKAYAHSANPEYKRVIQETVQFLNEEWRNPEGAFYAALDADSNGEEGDFYVWKINELNQLLGADYDLFAKYYNVGSFGLWEGGKNLLMKLQSDKEFCKINQLDENQFNNQITQWKTILKQHRNNRVKPGLDNKIITSWNALAVIGLLDAYQATKQQEYKNIALQTLEFLLNQQLIEGQLFRSFANGNPYNKAFLDDYAFLIQALIQAYQITFNESYLLTSKSLLIKTNEQFFNHKNHFYSYKSNLDEMLVSPTYEITDSVMPASNSTMAKNLLDLGVIFGNHDWMDLAVKMLKSLQNQIQHHPTSYANWMDLQSNLQQALYQIVIIGPKAKTIRQEFFAYYLPYATFIGSESGSDLPIAKNRYKPNETWIYVCQNQTCQLPVATVKEALLLLGVNAQS